MSLWERRPVGAAPCGSGILWERRPRRDWPPQPSARGRASYITAQQEDKSAIDPEMAVGALVPVVL